MGDNEEIVLTPIGYRELNDELERLRTTERREVADRIRDAITYGELTENSEYEDAKNAQAFLEGRIQYLENILRSSKIIENTGKTDEVRLGSLVTIVEEGAQEEEVYSIVGAAEANPREGKISHESPIGAALLGHRKGDKVRAKTPGGDMIFKIKSIK